MRGCARRLSYSAFVATLLVAALLVTIVAPVPLAAQAADWEKTWQEMKAAGQAEGTVIFRTGATETQQYRQKLAELEKAVGLRIQLLSGSPTELASKLVADQRAGKPTADLWISGPSSIVNIFVPAGAVQDLKPLLLNPEVTDPKVWFGGELPWASDWSLAFAASANYGIIVYNPKLLNPDDFDSYWDILNPKWKGKIVMRDPRANAVESPRTFLYAQLGKEFYTRLIEEMDPVIASDARTAVEWVARGKYAFCIIGCNRSGEAAEADGLPVKSVFPKYLKEGFPVDMGGNGLTVISNPPHPAATKYFINWFLSREGQILYQKITGNFSLRNDISREGVDPENVIKTEDERYHWYGWRFPEPREESQSWMRDMMKAHGY
jgi:iron(III) transport system substrate-binding protein